MVRNHHIASKLGIDKGKSWTQSQVHDGIECDLINWPLGECQQTRLNKTDQFFKGTVLSQNFLGLLPR